ncbi:MAG: hypothetical protein Q8R79_04535, partial [Legionellaceae bacterium]|nr:hypothetical protein [Legionellaceae bacterium]
PADKPRDVGVGKSLPFLLQLLKVLQDNPALPLADLLRQQHGLDGAWYIFSPIFWEAGHNNATLRNINPLANAPADRAQALFDALQDHLSPLGFTLFAHNDQYWLLQAPTEYPILNTQSPEALYQQPMIHLIQQLDSTLMWTKLLTELQMLCATLKLNLPSPVNGVWIWGGGHLGNTYPLRVWTDTPEADYWKVFSQIKPQRWFENARLKRNDVLILENPTLNFNEKNLTRYPYTISWKNALYSSPRSWWSKLFGG